MRPHETLAAQLLDRGAVAADGQANISGGDEQLAWRHVAAVMRAAAQAMVYRQKTIDQLVNDIRRPRAVLIDDDTRSERPVAKRREREDP